MQNAVKGSTCQINDVETNPGPVLTDFDVSKISYFCSLLTGKQCVANSLISIVYQHHGLNCCAADCDVNL